MAFNFCNFSIVQSIRYLFVATILFFLVACSKKPDTGDKTAPSITIVSPQNNQHFTAGQTITTVANANDNDVVTELHIHVTNKATGVLLRDIHSYPDQPNGTVQDSFTADSAIIYTIVIIAKDPAQNVATKQVEVSSN